jgi:hypothetical protein
MRVYGELNKHVKAMLAWQQKRDMASQVVFVFSRCYRMCCSHHSNQTSYSEPFYKRVSCLSRESRFKVLQTCSKKRPKWITGVAENFKEFVSHALRTANLTTNSLFECSNCKI